jgi:hypothetical protein
MRCVSFDLQSGATLSWQADQDVVIRSTYGTASCVFSLDPQLTYFNYGSPAADLVSEITRFLNFQSGIDIILRNGERLYCAPNVGGGAASAQVYFENVADVVAEA